MKYIWFYNGEYFNFSINEQGKVYLKSNQKPQIIGVLIVSSHYYSERSQRYPVSNKKDVNALINLSSAHIPNCHHLIQYVAADESHVNFWEYSSNTPKAMIRLPESLLYAQLLKNNSAMEIHALSNIFVGLSNNVVYSSFIQGILNNIKNFSMSVGIPSANVYDSCYSPAESLWQGLLAIPKLKLFSFVQRYTANDKKRTIKKVSIPILTLLSAYILITSAFLIREESSLKQEIGAVSTAVNNALEVQEQLKIKQQQAETLNSFLSDKHPISYIWAISYELYSVVTFTNIRTVDDRIVFRGLTSQATNVLEQLSENEFVVDPKFDYPTRVRSGEEFFVISFKLNVDVIKRMQSGVNVTLESQNMNNSKGNEHE